MSIVTRILVPTAAEAAQLARIAAMHVGAVVDNAGQRLAILAKLPAEQGWDRRACGPLQGRGRELGVIRFVAWTAP